MPRRVLSVVIPAKNEGKGLTITCEMLVLFVASLKEIIVVVEDISDLSCKAALNARIGNNVELKVIINEFQSGVTGSLCSGIKASEGEYILLYPSDEINPIFAIEDFVFALRDGYDIVSATRYAKGGKRLGVRLLSGNLLSRSVGLCFQIVTLGKITDPTTGVKAFRKNIWDMERIFSTGGWSYPMELQINYLKKKKKFIEVPITSVDRPFDGQSSFKIGVWIWNYMRVLFCTLKRTYEK